MEVNTERQVQDSHNYAKDYRNELKNSKQLKEYLNVQIKESDSLKSSLKLSGLSAYLGSNLENLSKITTKELNAKLETNKTQVNQASKSLDELNVKYDGIKKALKSKNIERNPAVYEFLQKNNTVQNNPLKKFFGIEKDFKKVSNKDLKTLLPALEKEHSSLRKESEKKVVDLKKEGSSIDDALSLKYREAVISVTKEKMQTSQKELNLLTAPIKKLIESIIDLDLKGIKESLKKTKPMDLAYYIKEVAAKNKDKDNTKVINLSEKLDILGKSEKKEVSLKR